MWRRVLAGAGVLWGLAGAGAAAAPLRYGIVGRVDGPPVPNWDYVTVDAASRRLYLAAQTAVVLDMAAGTVVAGWPSGGGMVHTVVPLGDGMVAVDDGHRGVVRFADAQTGAVRATVNTNGSRVAGERQFVNPDAMILEPKTGLLVAVNSESGELVLLDPKRHVAVGRIRIGSRMEAPVADGSGMVFVNLNARNGIAEVDLARRTVVRTLLFHDCKGPSGVGYEPSFKLLISVCDDGMAEVITPADMKVTHHFTVAHGADGVMIDPIRHMAFVAGGDSHATLSVIRINGPDDVSVVQTIPLEPGVRLGGVDAPSGKVFLPSVDFDTTAKPIRMMPQMPAMLPTLPRTFHFIVVGPQ